ncbi:MAG: HAD family phosphatase [Pirellulales bacterium]
MTAIRFVYFDMGNVLLHFDHHRAARQMAHVAACEEDLVWRTVFAGDLMQRYEGGRATDDDFYREFAEQTKSDADRAELDFAGAHIFTPNYSLWAVVNALTSAGYRTGILSNTCPAHWRYVVKHYPGVFLGNMAVHALSYELGACKPDPTIFTRAAALAGVRPEEIFYCDDIPGHVAGARAVGYDAVLFTDTPTLVRDLRARGLRFNY